MVISLKIDPGHSISYKIASTLSNYSDQPAQADQALFRALWVARYPNFLETNGSGSA